MRRNTILLLKYMIFVIIIILGFLFLRHFFGHQGTSVERFVNANNVQEDDRHQDLGVSVHFS